jgi:hypothetical protein
MRFPGDRLVIQYLCSHFHIWFIFGSFNENMRSCNLVLVDKSPFVSKIGNLLMDMRNEGVQGLILVVRLSSG